MSTTNSNNIFRDKVIPIMDKVRDDLNNKRADELRKHSTSFPGLLIGSAGPDGGMAAMDSYQDSLKITGKWNSKTTEDYIAMVKDELRKQHITVDASMEKKMIDKMVKDVVPKSSAEYIIRKAAQSSIFYISKEVGNSPVDKHINAEAEKLYKPSAFEKNAGLVLGSTADLLSMGGIGGGFKTAATWVGGDLLASKVIDRTGIPSVIAPGYEDEYRKLQAQNKSDCQKEKAGKKQETKDYGRVQETKDSPTPQSEAPQQQNPEKTNSNGWTGLLTSFGLNGLGDITHNLGYVLAMLPDMLVGVFTGKTKNLKIEDNMLPLASIVAGMFVKNPILKMVLMGTGGLNLLNKAGHEAIDIQKDKNMTYANVGKSNYRIYPDEPLNERICNPQIKGNCLVASIDRVLCTIALPDTVVEAYNQGALPMNTLANAVLAKNDQMRQIAQQNYEQNRQQSVYAPHAQR